MLSLSVGVEFDNEKVELLISQVKGKDITELVAAGREKLASVPAGGGACVAVAAGSAAPAGAAAPATKSKKEEKLEEKEESDDVILLTQFLCTENTNPIITFFLVQIYNLLYYSLIVTCSASHFILT